MTHANPHIGRGMAAAWLRRWRAEQWAHLRLRELAVELTRIGVDVEVDWGRTAWEPCLHVGTPFGREIVWCRPVAVTVEDGQPVYRWRYCWSDYRGDPGAFSYPAADVPRAARKIAEFARRGRAEGT